MEKSNKGIVILLVIIILAVIGFGGYFVYKFTDKIDSQEKQITELKKTTEKLAVAKEKSTTSSSKTSAVVEDEEDEEEEEVETSTSSSSSSSSSSKKALEKTIEELFLDELKNQDGLLSYRVEAVSLYDEEEKQKIIKMDGGENYKSSDELAVVRYSVKPENMEDSNWIAGNGTEQGDWILNKAACVCLRGNKLVGNVFNTGW